MDAEVEDALAGNSDYLRDVVTTVEEGVRGSCDLHQQLDIEAKRLPLVCSLV
jgi:hypothetical protein